MLLILAILVTEFGNFDVKVFWSYSASQSSELTSRSMAVELRVKSQESATNQSPIDLTLCRIGDIKKLGIIQFIITFLLGMIFKKCLLPPAAGQGLGPRRGQYRRILHSVPLEPYKILEIWVGTRIWIV